MSSFQNRIILRAGGAIRRIGIAVLLVSLSITASSVFGQSTLQLEEQTFQQAAASADASIVRIETVGGTDLVGEVLTGTGPTTGVVVDPEGYVITSSFNFAANPATIIVTLGDERKLAARVVAEDKSRMLTLLKVEATGLKTLPAASKDQLQVGQWAVALGRTYDPGFPNVSVGIISAVNRLWGRAVQTDAKTSPVNYGGPLLNAAGECIGIIVPMSPQEQTTTAGMEWYDAGIGFAIPLEDVYRVLPRLKSGETLHRGLLGVSFEDDGPLGGEPKVLAVRPESPADKAGILQDDVISAIDGVAVTRIPMLRQKLGERYANDMVVLMLKRGDQALEMPITLTAELKAYQFPWLGLLPERDRAEGCVVRHVFADSPAAAAGLLAGDEIVRVGDEAVASTAQLRSQLRRFLVGEKVAIEVQRNGQKLERSLVLGAFPDELPTAVPVAAAKPADAIADLPKTGRFNEKLPGDGAEFWGLVPEDYHASRSVGLLVWLHPAGDTMETEITQALQDAGRDRGFVIAGVRAANLAGWTNEEEGVVKGVIDWFAERYAVDPQRIVLFGDTGGGDFAIKLAFKYRDTVRGAIVSGAVVRNPPPDNDPDYRLQLLFINPLESEQREDIEQSVTGLRKLKYPTASLDQGPGQDLFSADIVDKLVAWLDALDRL